MEQYKVIKDITLGWETSAKIGDILTVEKWKGDLTLMKGDKAVCDIDSLFGTENCVKIK